MNDTKVLYNENKKKSKCIKVTDNNKIVKLRINRHTSVNQIKTALKLKFDGRESIGIECDDEIIFFDSIYECVNDNKVYNIIFSSDTINEVKDFDNLNIIPKGEFKGSFEPIGYFESCFKHKNGTPRQGCLTPESKGRLKIFNRDSVSAKEALEGLDLYSHIWIIFWFHNNGSSRPMAKVCPPRLNGKSTGVFSTRSPHRFVPIGLTLAKLDYVKEDYIYVSGIDIIEGTPILDIKPYIPKYDCPTDDVHIAEWVEHDVPIQKVVFEKEVEEKLIEFSRNMDYLKDVNILKSTIENVLLSDPRSVYRKKKCEEEAFGFHLDSLNIQCRLDGSTVNVYNVELV